jgi:hypothetical protein
VLVLRSFQLVTQRSAWTCCNVGPGGLGPFRFDGPTLSGNRSRSPDQDLGPLRASLRFPPRTRLPARCLTRVCSRRGPRSARTTQLKPGTLDSAACNWSRTIKTATRTGSEIRIRIAIARVRACASGRASAEPRAQRRRSRSTRRRERFAGRALAFSERPDNSVPDRVETDRSFSSCFFAVLSSQACSCCARSAWPCWFSLSRR